MFGKPSVFSWSHIKRTIHSSTLVVFRCRSTGLSVGDARPRLSLGQGSCVCLGTSKAYNKTISHLVRLSVSQPVPALLSLVLGGRWGSKGEFEITQLRSHRSWGYIFLLRKLFHFISIIILNSQNNSGGKYCYFYYYSHCTDEKNGGSDRTKLDSLFFPVSIKCYLYRTY